MQPQLCLPFRAGCLSPLPALLQAPAPWKEALAVRSYSEISSQAVGRGRAPLSPRGRIAFVPCPLPHSSVVQGEVVGTDLLEPNSRPRGPPPTPIQMLRSEASRQSFLVENDRGSLQALGHFSVLCGFSTFHDTVPPEGKPGVRTAGSGRWVTLAGCHPGSQPPPTAPPPGWTLAQQRGESC